MRCLVFLGKTKKNTKTSFVIALNTYRLIDQSSEDAPFEETQASSTTRTPNQDLQLNPHRIVALSFAAQSNRFY